MLSKDERIAVAIVADESGIAEREIIAALPIVRVLDASQRSEARALQAGRWLGEHWEVSGLRALGVQDDALGVTPLGAAVVAVLDADWRVLAVLVPHPVYVSGSPRGRVEGSDRCE